MFGDILFNQIQIGERFNLSRTTIHKLLKSGKLKCKEVQNGAIKKKMLTWDSVAQLSDIYPDHVKIPTIKKRVFCNLKGGTGKTTLTSQCSMTAASSGLRTLLIDLDGQGHSTLSIARHKKFKSTILDCLVDQVPAQEVIQNICPFLDIFPANDSIPSKEIELFWADKDKVTLLKSFIAKIEDRYDQIYIDTPPSTNLLTMSALILAEELICVTVPEFYSTDGMLSFINTIGKMRKVYPEITKNIKIVPNFHASHSRDCKEATSLLRNSPYAKLMTTTEIRTSADLKEAHKRGVPIWFYKNSSAAAHDFKQFYTEITGV